MRAVSFSEWLRPWHGLGLSYILSERPLALSDSLYDSEQEQDFQKTSQNQPLSSGSDFISDSYQNVESLGENSENAEKAERSRLEQEKLFHTYPSPKTGLPVQELGQSKIYFQSAVAASADTASGGTALAGVTSAGTASADTASGGTALAGVTSAGTVSAGSAQPFREGEARSLNSDTSRKKMDHPELKDTEWPSSYTKIFEKLSPAPALWTYRDLGYDLSGNAELKRSEFLKEAIGLLGFPRGTSIFWPYSLPIDGQLQDNFPVFFDGIKRLQPKIIIVIGQSGMKPFNDHLPLSTPFTQGVFMGKLLVLLPEFSQFYNSEDLVQRAAGYLRGVLSGMKLF